MGIKSLLQGRGRGKSVAVEADLDSGAAAPLLAVCVGAG